MFIIQELATKGDNASISATEAGTTSTYCSNLLTRISPLSTSGTQCEQFESQRQHSQAERAAIPFNPTTPLEAPQKCRIPVNPFSGKITTITTMLKEYTEGLEGQPSLKQLYNDHGEGWMFWRVNCNLLCTDREGKILRLKSEPPTVKKTPLRNKKSWGDAWNISSRLYRMHDLYVEVLRDQCGFSERDAATFACRILEKEKANSGLSLKMFIEDHCKVAKLKELKKVKDSVLQPRLTQQMHELDSQ